MINVLFSDLHHRCFSGICASSIPKTNRREGGFTLLELLTTSTLLFTLAALVVPSYGSLTESFTRREATELVVADIRRARAEALSQGARIILTRNTYGTEYTVGLDRTPYSNSLTPDTTMYKRVLATNISATGPTTIVFDSRGYLINNNGSPTSATVQLRHRDRSYLAIDIYSSGSLKVYK